MVRKSTIVLEEHDKDRLKICLTKEQGDFDLEDQTVSIRWELQPHPQIGNRLLPETLESHKAIMGPLYSHGMTASYLTQVFPDTDYPQWLESKFKDKEADRNWRAFSAAVINAANKARRKSRQQIQSTGDDTGYTGNDTKPTTLSSGPDPAQSNSEPSNVRVKPDIFSIWVP
jgi:hypothetical protein